MVGNPYMKKNAPLYVFEAHMYLKNRVNGFTVEKSCETISFRFPKNKDKYERYFDLLLQLDKRLEKVISVDETVLQNLYYPLSPIDDKHNAVAQDCVADMLTNEHGIFTLQAPADFFKQLRSSTTIIRALTESVNPDYEPNDEPVSITELYAAINACNWAQESKLILFDLAINTGKYIDMLDEALTPVALEFAKCKELWEPLTELFYCWLDTGNDEESLLKECFGSALLGEADCYVAYPSVMGFSQAYFNSSNNNGKTVMLAYVGVLYDTFIRISSMESNAEAELSRIMSVLGDPSRFNILLQLGKRPSYGRELSKILNITPGAVSQHLSILLSTGLVLSNNIGNKVYYSLDNEKMQYFIGMLQKSFPNRD